jgi:thiol-disulfide isomerase/thioredoxin
MVVVSFLSGAQNVEVIKYPELKRLIDEPATNHRIFNFWATWCKPCIKELPYFEEVTSSIPKEKVKVYLVSLDFVEQLETKVKPFIAKRNIASDVLLLDETDFDEIISGIHSSWTGAIPATLMIKNNGEVLFFEKEFKEGELTEIINKQLE